MKFAFWLFYTGESQKAKERPSIAKDIQIKVGRGDYCIGIVKASEIEDYIDDEFYRQHKLFERFKMGFGLPRGLSWDQQPVFIMDIIDLFMYEYRQYENTKGQ